jgi:3-deoxy-D-manno-octulosonic-acid transferase
MLKGMIYNMALAALFPKLLFQRLFLGKYRGNFLQRLGIRFPEMAKGGRKLVWLHAVSLGETKAIVPLASKIKSQMPEALLVISSVTETGHAEAVKSIPFAKHLFLPFDLSWIIKPIMRRMAPDLVILSETDLWKNFLQGAKEAGARIVLVNGKLSERSCRNYQRFSFAGKAIWPQIDLYCVQSEIYRERFALAGVPASRMVVTGNIKHDRKIISLDEQGKEEWKKKFGIRPGEKVVVLACTHDPEEKILLEVLIGLWERFPNLKVLLAPRHPERFDEVEQLIRRAQIPLQRYSLLSHPTEKLFLIDRMGLLDPCYQIADLALVGGSFTPKVGGHNILEPCAHGTPVLFGPYMQAQPDMVQLVKDYGAGKQIAAERIHEAISRLLSSEEERNDLGKRALKMMEECRGATGRTLNSILSLWQIKPSAIV